MAGSANVARGWAGAPTTPYAATDAFDRAFPPAVVPIDRIAVDLNNPDARGGRDTRRWKRLRDCTRESLPSRLSRSVCARSASRRREIATRLIEPALRQPSGDNQVEFVVAVGVRVVGRLRHDPPGHAKHSRHQRSTQFDCCRRRIPRMPDRASGAISCGVQNTPDSVTCLLPGPGPWPRLPCEPR